MIGHAGRDLDLDRLGERSAMNHLLVKQGPDPKGVAVKTCSNCLRLLARYLQMWVELLGLFKFSRGLSGVTFLSKR